MNIHPIFEPGLITFSLMIRNRKDKKCRCTLLLLLFLSFFCSNLFFNHSHLVDGIIIVHSHPFKAEKDGKPLHNHSSNSFVLIHILNNFVTTAAFSAILAIISLIFFRVLHFSFNSSCLKINQGLQIQKRGPPSIMLLLSA